MLDPNAEALAELIAGRVLELLRGRDIVVPEYLTVHEAATFTNFPFKTLEQYRRQGVGPRYSSFRRSVRYHVDDLRAWLRDHAVEPEVEK